MKHFHAFLSFFFAPLCLALDDGAGGGGGAGAPAAGGSAGAPPAAGSTPPAAGGTPPPAGGTPPATQPVASGAAPILNDKGEFATGWADKFGAPSLSKFTTLEGMAKSYASLEKMIGAKGIIPPGPNATPEEKAAFYDKLGRPAKPEDYGVKMPEKIGDKAVPKEIWDDGRAKAFTEHAHKIGLTKEQVAALVEFDLAQGLSLHETNSAASQKAVAAVQEALKAEWGAEYAPNLGLAQKALQQLGVAGEVENLSKALGDDPAFLKIMAKVGKAIAEQPAAGARGTQHQTQDPKAKIAAIHADKTHPWQAHNAKANPKAHADAVKEMAALYALAYPG